MKIVIDGNIGCGKTTQLKILENIGFNVRYEPIEDWPLDLFYSDMERWGFLFQIVVLQTLKIDNVHENTVYERCPLSSKEIFWKAMKKTDTEDIVYNRQYDIQGWGPDLYILIDKNPDVCMKHLNQREQSGDSGVTLEYLKLLDENYKTMFNDIECPKYKIDGNQPIVKVTQNILGRLVQHGCILGYEADEKLVLNTLESCENILGKRCE